MPCSHMKQLDFSLKLLVHFGKEADVEYISRDSNQICVDSFLVVFMALLIRLPLVLELVAIEL